MKQKMGMEDASKMPRMFFKGGTMETGSVISEGKARFVEAKPKMGPDIKHKPPRLGFGGAVKRSGPF